ncbi:hypothetical protein Bsel_0259 [[Bacillus] selenitireducens MLS10]|uniref:Uncharacterized protein n=2 Tax=Salisediminibacterium selenitireducens TaxID=85683 RepID=D6XWG0_BACIE|nr:hypothetical protein Bsel_0259 [[Bacillus] selenitireducens MLS10]
MYLLIPLGFIAVSFIILIARRKSMQEDLAFVKAHPNSQEAAIRQKAMIRWIWGVTIWGVVSMTLVVWLFQTF